MTNADTIRRQTLEEVLVAVQHIPPCPFDGPHNYKPTDPCPVCGDLGTFSFEGNDEPSKCQTAAAVVRNMIKNS